jgi:H+-translocating NAD(P) transhydrogenase subunit alpha
LPYPALFGQLSQVIQFLSGKSPTCVAIGGSQLRPSVERLTNKPTVFASPESPRVSNHLGQAGEGSAVGGLGGAQRDEHDDGACGEQPGGFRSISPSPLGTILRRPSMSVKRSPFALRITIRAAMRVGVPAESVAGEQRVALVPEVVARLVPGGFEVVVERGAGEAASFPDAAFEEAGARVGADPWDADAVVKVQSPTADEAGRLREGQVLIGFLQPLTDHEGIERLSARGVTGFAMESIPRITRAQPMDALSSQATVSGYKATLLAAEWLPKFFPMLMTAAGTVAPAKVLVLGAGVAGLQAIATARRLGAVVTGFDVRPVVREQIESLGASWLDVGVVGEETEGGYAQELSEEQQRKQQEELEARVPEFDVVITTALIPGRPAPRLIPAGAVAAMRPGSVIVDLAAEAGGNCELTTPGEIAERERVTIVGLTNLPSTMPYHASQLYARNVAALLHHLAPEGDLVLDFEDEITAGACVTRKEEVPA